MNFLATLLKKIRFRRESPNFAKVINFLTFKRIKLFQVYQFENRFNKKMDKLIQRVCKHPTTYEDHYWSGGKLKCSVCYKTLKVLWLPTVVKNAEPASPKD